jgi:hypothetical protein
MRVNIFAGLARVRWDRIAAVILTPLVVAAFVIEPPLWALITLAALAWLTLWLTIRYERAPRYKRTR